MKIIVCIAENNGILFNKRRVSRDEKVIQDILTYTHSIKISEYSEPLFEGYDIEGTEAEYLFVEEAIECTPDVDELIIYKWNRDYPADTFFKFKKTQYTMTSTMDFEGKSHERITREIWKRK